jgi:hypothetical protein
VEEKIRKDGRAPCMWHSDCPSRLAHASGQGKRNISSGDRRLHCRMSGKIVRMRSGLRCRAENNIFTSVDLVNCRHALETGIDFRFPQHLAGPEFL